MLSSLMFRFFGCLALWITLVPTAAIGQAIPEPPGSRPATASEQVPRGREELSLAAQRDSLRTFDACWARVRNSFYDPKLHGLDWDEVRRRYRPLAAATPPGRALHALLNRMLAELRASHTAILERDIYQNMSAELDNVRTLTYGLQLEETVAGRFFVRARFEGGPAADAKLQLGDRIVLVNGISPDRSPFVVEAGYDPGLPGAPLFTLRASGYDEKLVLLVQPLEDEASRRTLTIGPREMNGVDACRNSIRIIERGGRRIGLLHIWYCSDGVARVLSEAIRGKLKNCDALVIDLRGRGGKVSVIYQLLAHFPTYKHHRSARRPPAPSWNKPVVFLTDRRSRSAKEVIALIAKEDKIGPVVGTRTEGAVLAAGFFELPDGAYVELAIAPVSVRGVTLEGHGVEPDHPVTWKLPYANGVDAILEAGLGVAIQELAKQK